VPLVLDAAHEQGAVEVDRGGREAIFVVEEAGFDAIDGKRLDVPIQAVELEGVQTIRLT